MMRGFIFVYLAKDHREDEKCIQNFVQKIAREITLKTWASMGG
jgi:hypothetical protein